MLTASRACGQMMYALSSQFTANPKTVPTLFEMYGLMSSSGVITFTVPTVMIGLMMQLALNWTDTR